MPAVDETKVPVLDPGRSRVFLCGRPWIGHGAGGIPAAYQDRRGRPDRGRSGRSRRARHRRQRSRRPACVFPLGGPRAALGSQPREPDGRDGPQRPSLRPARPFRGSPHAGRVSTQSLRRNFDSSHRFASRPIVSLACRPARRQPASDDPAMASVSQPSAREQFCSGMKYLD